MNLTQMSGTATAIGAVIAVGLFALPSYIGAIKQTGLLRGLLIIVSLGVFALGFETLAIKTGLPYGRFAYSENLGYKFIGITPWIVAAAYPPILLGAFWLARKISSGFLVVVFTALFATIVDVALDPAMVKLSFWQWDVPGPFFGVPIINFVGWFISGLIGAAILKALWGDAKVRRLTAYSVFAITLFWSGVNLGVEQFIPAFVGLAISTVLLVLFFIEKRQENSEEQS